MWDNELLFCRLASRNLNFKDSQVMKVFLIVTLLLPGVTIAKRSNLIYILTDDLSYGDLGCYGQKVVRTPRIDKTANSPSTTSKPTSVKKTTSLPNTPRSQPR